MTTKKEPPSKISKHKVTTVHKKPAMPQAFDIMPRSQVRPDATSRPVITSSKPAVADNTLTTAPQVNLGKHKILDVTSPPGTGKSQGVSVADLIAKRSEKTGHQADGGAPAGEAAGNAEDDNNGYFLPVEKPKTAPAANDVELSDDGIRRADETGAAVNDSAAVQPGPEEEAAADETKDVAAGEAAKSGEAASSSSQPGVPAEDSLENALKEDEAEKPLAHSQSFKEALKDMKDAEDSIGEDGRAHHELYGGKPVIVIHKNHGSKSVLSWLLWFVVCLLLALVIVNFLLDAEVISTTYNVPHTNLIKPL